MLPPILASAAAAQCTHVKESIQTPEAGVVGVVAAPRKIELGHQSHSHPHSLDQPTPTFSLSDKEECFRDCESHGVGSPPSLFRRGEEMFSGCTCVVCFNTRLPFLGRGRLQTDSPSLFSPARLFPSSPRLLGLWACAVLPGRRRYGSKSE